MCELSGIQMFGAIAGGGLLAAANAVVFGIAAAVGVWMLFGAGILIAEKVNASHSAE